MNDYPGRLTNREFLSFSLTFLVQMKIAQGGFTALFRGARQHLGEAET